MQRKRLSFKNEIEEVVGKKIARNHIPNFRNVAITYMADSLRNEYRVVRLMNSCSVTFFGFVYNPTTLEH